MRLRFLKNKICCAQYLEFIIRYYINGPEYFAVNVKSVGLVKQLMYGVWFLFSVKISIDVKNKVFDFCQTPGGEAAATYNCWSYSAQCTLMACGCKCFCSCSWEYKVRGNNLVFRKLQICWE